MPNSVVCNFRRNAGSDWISLTEVGMEFQARSQRWLDVSVKLELSTSKQTGNGDVLYCTSAVDWSVSARYDGALPRRQRCIRTQMMMMTMLTMVVCLCSERVRVGWVSWLRRRDNSTSPQQRVSSLDSRCHSGRHSVAALFVIFLWCSWENDYMSLSANVVVVVLVQRHITLVLRHNPRTAAAAALLMSQTAGI